MLKPLILLALLATACDGRAAPSDTTGPGDRADTVYTVVAVLDGDSVRVVVNGLTEEIRLLGINAPEFEECWADEARDTLASLLDGKVMVAGRSTDQFGRTLAYLYSGEQNLNLAMVESGAAIATASAHSFGLDFTTAEGIAYVEGAGLWSPVACGPATEARLRIREVFFDAPGPDDENPNGEFVVITNDGAAVDLSGWGVRDESSVHRFAFPDGFALGNGEAVAIRSGCGEDSSSELFWCAAGAVWNNGGDMALLLDAYGNVVDRWRYARADSR